MNEHVGEVRENRIYQYEWSCNCAASSSGRSYKTKKEAQDRLDAHIERMK